MAIELFYSVRSPFARRVRVALQRLAIAFDAKEINVFEPTPEFLDANPLGLAPVMRVPEGREWVSIPDSSAILEYLHESHGERIWPRDLKTRARVRGASMLATGLMQMTVNLYLESQRTQPDASWRQDYQDSLVRTLDAITRGSVMHLPWKVSDLQLTQAGYDLMIALDYLDLRLKGFDWRARYPSLGQFVDKHRTRGDLLPTSPPPA